MISGLSYHTSFPQSSLRCCDHAWGSAPGQRCATVTPLPLRTSRTFAGGGHLECVTLQPRGAKLAGSVLPQHSGSRRCWLLLHEMGVSVQRRDLTPGHQTAFPQKPHSPLPWTLLVGMELWEEAASEPLCTPYAKGLVCAMMVPPHPELPAAVQTCSADVVVCGTTFTLSINRKAALPPAAWVRQREAIPVFLEERMPVPAPPCCPWSCCCLWSRVCQDWDAACAVGS